MSGKFRILVVDDEEALREPLAMILELDGYEVKMAENGRDAFEKTKAWRPNLVITDIRMPIWDGYMLQKSLEELGSPLIPVLFISGYAGLEDPQPGKGRNIVGFISKPFRMEQVLDVAGAFARGERKLG